MRSCIVLKSCGLITPEMPSTPPVSESNDLTNASNASMLLSESTVKLSLDTLLYRYEKIIPKKKLKIIPSIMAE